MLLESHDSLPYIDTPPTPAERDAITAHLITQLDPSHLTTPHPSLRTSYTPTFTPLLAASHDLIAATSKARAPGTGVDLARYEEPTLPAHAAQYHDALRAAYTSHTYLAQRTANLALLKQYGRDAWLIGNEQLEAELRAVERELAGAREAVREVEGERRAVQDAVVGEIRGLEEAWRESVGRAIQVEVDAERLRGEILRRRRGGGA